MQNQRKCFHILFLYSLILLLTTSAYSQTMIAALMHSDNFINIDHLAIRAVLERSMMSTSETKSIHLVHYSGTDFRTAWTGAVTQALAIGRQEEVFFLISSHGIVGNVSFNQENIPLDFLVEEIAKAVKISETHGNVRKVNMAYGACYSGSIFKEFEKAWKKYDLKSKVSVISSAPPGTQAHGTNFSKYFTVIETLRAKMKSEGLNYCRKCSEFDRFGRLIAAAKSIDHSDVPSFWSNDPDVTALTSEDLLTEIKIFSHEQLRISKDPDAVFNILKFQKLDSLTRFLYRESPQLFYQQLRNILQIDFAILNRTGGVELAELVAALYPHDHMFNFSTLRESLAGYVAGWILLDERVSNRKQFFNSLRAHYNQDDFYHITSAARLMKISIHLTRGQIEPAVVEFEKLVAVREGWKHSSSPIHTFISNAAEMFLLELLKIQQSHPNQMQKYLDRLLKDNVVGAIIVKKVLTSPMLPIPLKNNSSVIRVFLSGESEYHIPSIFDFPTVIKVLGEMKKDPAQVSHTALNRWIEIAKKQALFDSDIEAVNRHLNLNLPFRLTRPTMTSLKVPISCLDLL
jgi:hypothetical protein